jgi:hypothetical protein
MYSSAIHIANRIEKMLAMYLVCANGASVVTVTRPKLTAGFHQPDGVKQLPQASSFTWSCRAYAPDWRGTYVDV